MVAAWEAGQRNEADKSVGELLADLSDGLQRLARAEVRLAVTETKRKARRAGKGAGALAVAGVLALVGLGVLAACAVLALAHVLPGWLAALLVGVGLFMLAGMAALFGLFALRRALPPVPERALHSVRDDIEVIGKRVRHDHTPAAAVESAAEPQRR